MRQREITFGLAVASTLICVGCLLILKGGQAEAKPPLKPKSAVNLAAAPPALTLNSDFPNLVTAPPAGSTPEQARPWFDTFSLQEFIALNWQAQGDARGVPLNPNDPQAFKDAFAPRADGVYPQVVWGTWKQAYELFEQGSVTPSAWDSFAAVLPCTNPLATPPKTFLDATPNDINESFSSPLIDQNRNYARYEIRLNKSEYGVILDKGLYLTENLKSATTPPNSVTLPVSTATTLGAVEVKGTWKPMTNSDDPKRYYIVNALVLDPNTKQAIYQKMGLVGLHIAHKTSPFTEWVWSTFEHVDNVATGPAPKPSYNNGTPVPSTPGGFDVQPPIFSATLPPNPNPVQVTRVTPIPTTPPMFSTVDLNTQFQALVAGTVWQNYQLITTQWPTKPGEFKINGNYPGDCGSPFPENSVSNTVIETYDQAPSPDNSCMACHYITAPTDFSWVLADRNHKTIAPGAQPQFLSVDRFASNRAWNTIMDLEPENAQKVSPLRRSLEKLRQNRAIKARAR